MKLVLITVVCPACETSYKLHDTMRGRSIICPGCKQSFTVPTANGPSTPPQPAPPGNGQRTGSVGDLVPLVEAQAAEPPAKSWKEPPPVRRPTPQEPPRELPPGAWAPPPVRRDAAKPTVDAPPEPAEERLEEIADEPAEEIVDDRPPVKRTGLIVIVGIMLFAVVFVAGGWWVWNLLGRSEGSMAAEADQAYRQGKFREAKDMFGQLQKNFPSSDKRDDYHFMEALSDFRAQARAPDADADAVLERLSSFLDDNRKAGPLKDRTPDLAESLGWTADAFAQRNTAPPDERPLAIVERIEAALGRLHTINGDVPSVELKTHIDAALGGVRQAVVHAQKLRAAVARIRDAAKDGTASKQVKEFLKQIKKEKRDLPDIDQDAEVQQVRAHGSMPRTSTASSTTPRGEPSWRSRTPARSRRASSSIRFSAARPTRDRRTITSSWRCPAASSTPFRAPTARCAGRFASASIPRPCRFAFRSRRASPNASWFRRPTTRPWTRWTAKGAAVALPDGRGVHRPAAGCGQHRLPRFLRRQCPRDRVGAGQGAGNLPARPAAHGRRRPQPQQRPALFPSRRVLRLRDRSGSAQMHTPALHRPPRRLAARRAADRVGARRQRGRRRLADVRPGRRTRRHAAARLPAAVRRRPRGGACDAEPAAGNAGLDLVPALTERGAAGNGRRHRRAEPIRHPPGEESRRTRCCSRACRTPWTWPRRQGRRRVAGRKWSRCRARISGCWRAGR